MTTQVYPENIEKMINQFKKDEFFQADLNYPVVQEAIKHWLGIKRLPVDEAEQKFNEDYRVLQAFGKIQNLQHACAKERVAFPIELVLRDFKRPMTESTDQGAIKIESETLKTRETSPSLHKGSNQLPLEGVLKKPKSDPRSSTKETSVRFANPPKELEVTFAVEKGESERARRLLRSPWFSMDSSNVAFWWGVQFFLIGVFVASRLI